MNAERTIASLSRLIALRGQEVERLGAELAAKEAERMRYRSNLARMEALLVETAPARHVHPAIALNCADFKGALLDMMRVHARELALHETRMTECRAAYLEARRKQDSVSAVLDRTRERVELARETRDRKRQDQLATQAWLRNARGDGLFPQRS
jgi:flagellar export protein FliJ